MFIKNSFVFVIAFLAAQASFALSARYKAIGYSIQSSGSTCLKQSSGTIAGAFSSVKTPDEGWDTQSPLADYALRGAIALACANRGSNFKVYAGSVVEIYAVFTKIGQFSVGSIENAACGTSEMTSKIISYPKNYQTIDTTPNQDIVIVGRTSEPEIVIIGRTSDPNTCN